jgi:lipoprotein-anchoring transpeptidase ErfK/SrfK
MTKHIHPHRISLFKMLLTGAFLSASIFSFGSLDAVWANSQNTNTDNVNTQNTNTDNVNPQNTNTNNVNPQKQNPSNTNSQNPNSQKKQSQHNKIATAIATLKKSDQRWIQIDLTEQNLIAWEGNKPVYAVTISSGKRSTPTLVGTFKVQTKHRKTRMRGPGYDVANVPHTMYYQGGYAIHGAYWHKRFGTPVSHGCVNLAPNHAKWIFEWADVGTPIVVKK